MLKYPLEHLEPVSDMADYRDDEFSKMHFDGIFDEDFHSQTLHDMTLQIFVRNPAKYDDDEKWQQLLSKVQSKFDAKSFDFSTLKH